VKSFAWETVSADFIRLINSNPNLPQQHHSILHGEQL
jgi:hypothetical protein